jgi:hypothetical protein
MQYLNTFMLSNTIIFIIYPYVSVTPSHQWGIHFVLLSVSYYQFLQYNLDSKWSILKTTEQFLSKTRISYLEFHI